MHPMLIVFPSSIFPLMLLFDVLYLVVKNDALWTTGVWLALAGVVATALAAIPGIVDLAGIPDESRAHRTAFIHFAVGVVTLLAYAAAAEAKEASGT